MLLVLIFLFCATQASANEEEFGKTYALLIGNQLYDTWEDLRTPHSDVDELEKILTKKFDFKVEIIKDATRREMIDKIEWYKARSSPRDNFLIYYAGHGHVRPDGGYWIGKEAKRESRGDWLQYRTISDLIDRNTGMLFKHVLVIADSCYSGAIWKRGVYNGLDHIDQPSGDSNEWIRSLSQSMSRTVLTSGGLEPVLDNVNHAKHSVFASELIRKLRNTQTILTTDRLYHSLKKDVYERAQRIVGHDAQKPVYGPIYGTGHNQGDFLFVPVEYQLSPILENDTVLAGLTRSYSLDSWQTKEYWDGMGIWNNRQTYCNELVEFLDNTLNLSSFRYLNDFREVILNNAGSTETILGNAFIRTGLGTEAHYCRVFKDERNDYYSLTCSRKISSDTDVIRMVIEQTKEDLEACLPNFEWINTNPNCRLESCSINYQRGYQSMWFFKTDEQLEEENQLPIQVLGIRVYWLGERAQDAEF